MSETWFVASGTPPRGKNVIQPLVDGEAAWLSVLAALKAARRTIHLAFWVMDLDHELDRPIGHELKDPVDRVQFTFFDVLEKKRAQGVKIRILLWILPNIPATEKELLEYLVPDFANPLDALAKLSVPPAILATLDTRVLKKAILGHYEVLLEPHPTHVLGSWHQKTVVVDDEVAFVGGMNAKQNDWDDFHDVFDYRRMRHASTAVARNTRKTNKTATDYPPRHDLMARVEGPLVLDVQDNFAARWNQAIDDKRFFHRNLVKIARASVVGSKGGGSTTGQIVRTMPKYKPTPLGEMGCLELYQQAIRSAKIYVYIEDQYFRSRTLALELAAAVTRNPKLILIVVTMPDMLADLEWAGIGIASPSTKWTADSFDILAKVIPGFALFQLKVADTDYKGEPLVLPIDVHAKIMIVDDVWYTIGSCNVNERGFLYEGEINVGAQDPTAAYKLRRRLWSEHLQVACPPDIATATRLWYDQARQNVDAEAKKKKPISRIFSFHQYGPLLPIVPKTWF